MNPPSTIAPQSLTHQKADQVGVAASILCAIHCALAPILLLALPTFGRVWAHPASHILVAIFVVPLAVFSIRKGYQTHKKRWILITASIGIFFVLIGAMLPAFTKSNHSNDIATAEANLAPPAQTESITSEEPTCESACTEGECGLVANENEANPAVSTGCVDNCCPSLLVDESGETSLHIPPAAIVTTMGGIFLITAHIGNLCSCGHACRTSKCSSCA